MSENATETRPIVPMKWEGQISDRDTARKYLIRYMAANFEDRTFMAYIRDELAGDFAYNLALALAQTAPVVPEGWTLVPTDLNSVVNMGWVYLDKAREESPLKEWAFSPAGFIAAISAAPSSPIAAPSEDAKDSKLIKQVRDHVVSVVRAFGEKACADYLDKWHKVEHIEQVVAATAQQKGGDK